MHRSAALEADPVGAEGALDLYTNKSGERGQKRRSREGCPNASRTFALRSSDGLWAPVACGRTSCLWCYRMRSFERAQMVYEDALLSPPQVAITWTTRSPIWDAARYREARAQSVRALRDSFGGFEYLEFIEQTTGRAPRSGGHRRGHGHMLGKPGPGGRDLDVLEVERVVLPIWKRTMGAWHVNVAALQSAGGAVHYLTLNLALEKGKQVQAPVDLPKGTRTLRASRGYWTRPRDERIAAAREANALRRHRWRLLEDGTPAELVDDLVEMEREIRRARTWEMVPAREHPLLGWHEVQ